MEAQTDGLDTPRFALGMLTPLLPSARTPQGAQMNGGRVQKNDGPNAPGRSSRSRLKTEAGMTHEQEGRVLLDLGCLSFFFPFSGGGERRRSFGFGDVASCIKGLSLEFFLSPLIHLI